MDGKFRACKRMLATRISQAPRSAFRFILRSDPVYQYLPKSLDSLIGAIRHIGRGEQG
jgi:hypothetical protein